VLMSVISSSMTDMTTQVRNTSNTSCEG
jgi:hypothetical protein